MLLKTIIYKQKTKLPDHPKFKKKVGNINGERSGEDMQEVSQLWKHIFQWKAKDELMRIKETGSFLLQNRKGSFKILSMLAQTQQHSAK